MARELHPGKKNSLDALCERYAWTTRAARCTGRCSTRSCSPTVWLAMTRGQETLDISMWPPRRLGGAASPRPRSLASSVIRERRGARRARAMCERIERESKGRCYGCASPGA
jgi:DNA polymerase-3 subunit epsilon